MASLGTGSLANFSASLVELEAEGLGLSSSTKFFLNHLDGKHITSTGRGGVGVEYLGWVDTLLFQCTIRFISCWSVREWLNITPRDHDNQYCDWSVAWGKSWGANDFPRFVSRCTGEPVNGVDEAYGCRWTSATFIRYNSDWPYAERLSRRKF